MQRLRCLWVRSDQEAVKTLASCLLLLSKSTRPGVSLCFRRPSFTQSAFVEYVCGFLAFRGAIIQKRNTKQAEEAAADVWDSKETVCPEMRQIS